MIENLLKNLAILVFIFIGLRVPDIDLKLMDVLHHRSIVTHSLLLPLSLLLFRVKLLKPCIAGLCIGISIHLTADAMSPMRGFALIYLPKPFKTSIGSWQSLVWLAVNSVIGGLIAIWLCRGEKFTIMVLFSVSALTYSIVNENNILPTLYSSVVLLIMYKFSKGKYCQIE